MTEIPNQNTLEQFKYSSVPFIYAISDEATIEDVLHMFPKGRYGLETGFGEEPTRFFEIDKTIPWIATEPGREFDSFIKLLKSRPFPYLSDLDLSTLHITHPLYALKTRSTDELSKNAHTLVYRNVDYRNMRMINYENLSLGQRVVFIVNRPHISEIKHYLAFLEKFHYDSGLLQVRSKQLPPLTYPFENRLDEYVLDFTKE